MKIAVICPVALPSPPPAYGGAEVISWLTAKYLAKHHDVTMIAAKGSKAEGFDLVETVEPSFHGGVEAEAYEMYKDKLGEFDVIIDHTHFFPAYKAKLENPRLKVIKVVHDYAPWSSPPPRESYDIIAGVSQWHAQFLSLVYEIEFDYIYNGIEVDRYKYGENKEDFLLFLNRLNPGKGAHIFVDICDSLKVRGIVAGDDDPSHGIDPNYRNLVLKKCVDSDYVEYLGLIPEDLKLELLSKAMAVVTPLNGAYRETFGLWCLEALASGTPVFTTLLGGPLEILGEVGFTKYGYVASDITDLVKAVTWFVHGKCEFDRKAMRQRAASFLNMMVEKYLNLIDRL